MTAHALLAAVLIPNEPLIKMLMKFFFPEQMKEHSTAIIRQPATPQLLDGYVFSGNCCNINAQKHFLTSPTGFTTDCSG